MSLPSVRSGDTWFGIPSLVLRRPVTAATVVLFLVMARSLRRLPLRPAQGNHHGAAIPFTCTAGVSC